MKPLLDDHPLASIFPLMLDEDFAALQEDIRLNGQHDPIYMYEGMVLDGRNRYRACTNLGIAPNFEPFKGKDALAFVISKNLRRRHLTESQRAMVAANIATAKQGERSDLEPSANLRKVTQPEAAKMLNVSERSVSDAKTVKDKGVPELVEAVEKGEATVSAAAKVAKLPKAEQKKAVKEGKVKEKAKEQREAKKEPEPEPVAATPVEALVAELTRLCRLTDALKREVEKITENECAAKFVHVESIGYQLSAARKALWQARPTEDCNCVRGGSKPKPECKACFGMGKTSHDRILKVNRSK